MAAKERFKVKGLKVEMWETSFRVEGMSKAVWVGQHITRDMVEQTVEAIYRNVYSKARKDASRRVANDMADHIFKNILDEGD